MSKRSGLENGETRGGVRGKGAKKRKIGWARGGTGQGGTWPHPGFRHATIRAEEETERGVPGSSDHACT